MYLLQYQQYLGYLAHALSAEARQSYFISYIYLIYFHKEVLCMSNYQLNKVDEAGEITKTFDMEVRVYPIAEPKGNTKAFAAVTIDGMFAISGISVIQGTNGLFASMPKARDNSGGFRDVVFPVTSEGRKVLNDTVIAEYAIALDALEIKQESTLAKIKEQKEAALRPTPDKSTTKGAKNKSEAVM